MNVLLEGSNSLVVKAEGVDGVAEVEDEAEGGVEGVVVNKERMSPLRILMQNWMLIMMRYDLSSVSPLYIYAGNCCNGNPLILFKTNFIDVMGMLFNALDFATNV